jgi:hypothetical protein
MGYVDNAEFHNTDDMIDSVNNIVHNHVQNMRKVGSEELGLDRRCGSAWVNDDYIVTDAGSRFDYYAGFEYVDAEDIRSVGEYKFYSRNSSRIAEALEHLMENDGLCESELDN